MLIKQEWYNRMECWADERLCVCVCQGSSSHCMGWTSQTTHWSSHHKMSLSVAPMKFKSFYARCCKPSPVLRWMLLKMVCIYTYFPMLEIMARWSAIKCHGSHYLCMLLVSDQQGCGLHRSPGSSFSVLIKNIRRKKNILELDLSKNSVPNLWSNHPDNIWKV